MCLFVAAFLKIILYEGSGVYFSKMFISCLLTQTFVYVCVIYSVLFYSHIEDANNVAPKLTLLWARRYVILFSFGTTLTISAKLF